MVFGEQFIEAGNHGQIGRRTDASQRLVIKSVTALKTRYAVHCFFVDQGLSLANVAFVVIAEQDAVTSIGDVSQRVNHVAAMSGSNIANTQRLVIGPYTCVR